MATTVLHESCQEPHTEEDRYEVQWNNEIINVWEKKDELLWTLTIKNKQTTITSVVDSNLVPTLKQYSWTSWRANRRPHQVKENKYYVKHGKTKTLTHCCLTNTSFV
jgi:hypothetical protein